MLSDADPNLTDEPASEGLGGFAEAGTIEPDVADQLERRLDRDVPTAPANPADTPAGNGPLNPA
jgi:hypothetical protein